MGNLITKAVPINPAPSCKISIYRAVPSLNISTPIRVRPTLDDSGSLVIKQLGATSAFLLASPEQLRRQGAPATPEELMQLDTVAMSSTDGRSALLLQGPQGQEFVFHHQPRYVADDLQTLKLAMLAGTGIGFLPENLSQAEIQAQLFVHVLPGWTIKPGMAHAVFPSRRGQVPAVRSFLDFLGTHMQGDRVAEGKG